MLIEVFRQSYNKEFPKPKKRGNVDMLSNFLMGLKADILFMQ